jgi:SRSO17 transposase
MMMDVVAAGLDHVHERVAGRFGRAEPRARVREYVSGLVAGLERKNGWTLAEWAGEVSPDGMQRLLRRADWDVDGVRDDVRAYVAGQLGDPGGVLIADDTGFLKRAPGRLACSGSIPALPGGRRTVRSGCSWRTPPGSGTR